MFRYLGKIFVTVDDARNLEEKKNGRTVSHSAMYKLLESIRDKGFLAKRRKGHEVGYTPVKNENQMVKYDQAMAEGIMMLAEAREANPLGHYSGCFGEFVREHHPCF